MAFDIKTCAAAPEGVLVWLTWTGTDDPTSLRLKHFKIKNQAGVSQPLIGWTATFDGHNRMDLVPGPAARFRPVPGRTLTVELRKKKCPVSVLPTGALASPLHTDSQAIAENTGRIAGADEFLVGYPVMTTEADASGAGTGGGATGVGARALVERNLKAILRNVPRDNDPDRLEASLRRAIERIDADGTVQYLVRKHPTGRGADQEASEDFVGAQASLVAFADAMMSAAEPLIANLRSLDVKKDPELKDAELAVFRSRWEEFVAELHHDPAPRRARADALADDLDARIDQVGGRLGMLAVDEDSEDVIRPIDVLRTPLNVVTTDEEQALTDYLALRNLVLTTTANWRQFNTDVYKKLPLGLGLAYVERALGVLAQSVEETEAALDSVFVDPDQRRSLRIGRGDDAMTVDDLLQWVSSYASEEGPQLVHEGGSRGIEAVCSTAQDLQIQVEAFQTDITSASNGRLPALRHPRVGNALAEIHSGLQTVIDAVSDSNATAGSRP